MRISAIAAFAALAVLSSGALAQNNKPSAPDAYDSAPTRNVTRTGETKPPGAAVPPGPNRMDKLEERSERLGREMEHSVCKC